MPKKRTSRLYLRAGGWYADLRDLTTEKPRRAMIPEGGTRATTDLDEAQAICSKLVAQLEAERRGIAIVGRGALTPLGEFAKLYLIEKAKAGRVTDGTIKELEAMLTRAVKFFKPETALGAIRVPQLEAW